jgi:integrase
LELPKFEELLAQFPPNLKPYITFLYFCGGRSGETELIEWSQVDLEPKLIRIEDDQTKDKQAREIPLPQRLVLMLERIEPKHGRVFDTTNIRKEWTKACAALGLGRIIANDRWRYRLGVRTEDSQSSNPGSIPGSATNLS